MQRVQTLTEPRQSPHFDRQRNRTRHRARLQSEPRRLHPHSSPTSNDHTTNHFTSGAQVSRIKERVEEKEGIPPVQQRLIYGGKQMYALPRLSGSNRSRGLMRSERNRADEKTAADYNLEGGNTLHLVLALRGGVR